MNTVKKRFGSNNSINTSPKKKSDVYQSRFPSNPGPELPDFDDLSPELVPIVTLLLSQSHRRYHEGIFMLYYDLNGDGKPADREWKEVYGILTGNQLAYWDAANLAEFRNNPEALLEASSKPNYINFTDSVYNAMKTLPAAKQNLDNVIIVSTTLKNRYIIQFKTYGDLVAWYIALRLATYEYQSLQEAYTGALLSARGSRLSDIRTVLAEKRFNHEDWVSIRYGSGMAWKRCYAVVEPSNLKRKVFTPGRILFYENEQMKKKQLMAVVSTASSVTAIYPQSPRLIDRSTMLKLDGYINFKSPSVSAKVPKKSLEDFKNTSIFMMPEEHSAVPGFDTLIRFLIPLLDSFGLYGRPKRLKADRIDPESLLFGLPTLPHVHFLETSDLAPLANRGDFLSWDIKQWTGELKSIMKGKLDRGYEGCGSSRGFMGAMNSLNSPNLGGSGSFKKPNAPKNMATSPLLQPLQLNQSHEPLQQQGPPKPAPLRSGGNIYPVNSPLPQVQVENASRNPNGLTIQASPGKKVPLGPPTGGSYGTSLSPEVDGGHRAVAHKSVQLADIYQKYSDIKSPSDQFHTNRNQLLNGSHERLIEEELPEGFRHISLNEEVGAYPKNDEDLFSEDDDEDVENLDSRNIGMLNANGSKGSSSSNGLVPPYANRNSSYLSVKSPMTQYHEFNEQFRGAVDNKKSRGQLQEFDYSDDDDDDDSSYAPSPPPHQYNTLPLKLPSKAAFNSVNHGTPRDETEYSSIHSETGNVQSNDSSPYSEHSKEGYFEKKSVGYPHDQQTNQRLAHQGRHIASPNQAQNSAPRYNQAPPPQILVNSSSPLNANSPGLPVVTKQQQQQQPMYSSQPQRKAPLNNEYVQSKQPQTFPPHGYPQQSYPQGQPQGVRSPPQQRPSKEQPVPQQQPQQQSYPQSSQFGYQVPPPQKQPQNQAQYLSAPPPPPHAGQQYRQAPPQQYQQGTPPPQQYRPQAGVPPSVNYQQQSRPVPQQGYPPQQPQSRPMQQQGYPPQQPRVQQSGVPPSVSASRPQPQQYPSQSGASMRGYNGSQQQQYQYQYQVNPSVPPAHQPGRRHPPPPPQQQQQQQPQGHPYGSASRQY